MMMMLIFSITILLIKIIQNIIKFYYLKTRTTVVKYLGTYKQ